MPPTINDSAHLTKLLFQYSSTVSIAENNCNVKHKVDLLNIKNLNITDHGQYDEQEEEFLEVKNYNSEKLRSQLVRYSFEKKTVRFADSENLSLTHVRKFFIDELPQVPKSAFKHLKCTLPVTTASVSQNVHAVCSKSHHLSQYKSISISKHQQQQPIDNKSMIPFFNPPSSRPDFFQSLKSQNVLLENAYFDKNFGIKGTVRATNLDFTKSITIRFTTNEWINQNEVQAVYVKDSSDGFSDRFEFTIPVNMSQVNIGSKVIFAIQFCCQNQEFWDNNSGQNYTFSVIQQYLAPKLSELNDNYTSCDIYCETDDQLTSHLWF